MADEAAKKAGKEIAKPTEEAKAEEGEEKEDEKDKGQTPNAGNGGTHEDLYTWEQTLPRIQHVNTFEGKFSKVINKLLMNYLIITTYYFVRSFIRS